MTKTLTQAIVSTLPECDICKVEFSSAQPNQATYDGKTASGMWAYMCETHFQGVGVGLGTGRGQMLLTEEQVVHINIDGKHACEYTGILGHPPLLYNPSVNCVRCVEKFTQGQLYKYSCGCTVYYNHLIPGRDNERVIEADSECGKCWYKEDLWDPSK